jgi:hypothetical protein
LGKLDAGTANGVNRECAEELREITNAGSRRRAFRNGTAIARLHLRIWLCAWSGAQFANS